VNRTTPELKTLSVRQRQMFDMLCNGMTQKEIAKYLGLSEKTVNAHIYITMKKLQVSNRAELVSCRPCPQCGYVRKRTGGVV